MRIGVDIGGTTVKIGIVENKKVKEFWQIPTKKESLFFDICESILSHIDKDKIECIGFGIPGHVKNNYILRMPNIGISDLDIKEEISSFFPNISISSDNDANVAALGETISRQDIRSAYMITLGTGVGGGYIYEGKVIDGANCCCGEIGHLYVDFVHNFPCSCGLVGCLETVASATGVVRLAHTYASVYSTKLDLKTATCKDILDSAKNNDPLGMAVLEQLGMYLGRGLSMIAVTVDVDLFLIGGGVSACGDILLDCVRKYYKKFSHYGVKDTPIEFAKLGNTAGMLGAAYLVD